MLQKYKQKLNKRARLKWVSNGLVFQLQKLNSSLKKSYMNTFYCNREIFEEGGNLVAHYCKNRWCLVCNHNRIGKLINEYEPELKKLQDKHFVTLTARTVDKENLSKRIDKMVLNFRKILSNNNENKFFENFDGIRKLECTARPENLFHPHFHIIVNGKKQAEWIVDQWLKNWKGEALPEGQNIRKADDKSTIELFKYFTKLITKTYEQNMFAKTTTRVFMHPEKLDVIFQAMKGRRVYQSFGKVKKVDEEVDEKAIIKAPYVGAIFKFIDTGYFDISTGEKVTDWLPSSALRKMIEANTEKKLPSET